MNRPAPRAPSARWPAVRRANPGLAARVRVAERLLWNEASMTNDPALTRALVGRPGRAPRPTPAPTPIAGRSASERRLSPSAPSSVGTSACCRAGSSDMAACQSCGVELPGRRSRCDACARARMAAAARQRYAADPAAAIERQRRWRAANREKAREQSRRAYRRRVARAPGVQQG